MPFVCYFLCIFKYWANVGNGLHKYHYGHMNTWTDHLGHEFANYLKRNSRLNSDVHSSFKYFPALFGRIEWSFLKLQRYHPNSKVFLWDHEWHALGKISPSSISSEKRVNE